MTYPAGSQRKVTPALRPIATAALAAAIFIADLLTPVGEAIAGLYVAVVLMATRFSRPRRVVIIAAGLLSSAVHHAAEAGMFTGLSDQALDLSAVIVPSSDSVTTGLVAGLVLVVSGSALARRPATDPVGSP